MRRHGFRYQVRRDTDESYSVVDVVIGVPADVGATSIQLTKLEALQLLERLQTKTHKPALEPVPPRWRSARSLGAVLLKLTRGARDVGPTQVLCEPLEL